MAEGDGVASAPCAGVLRGDRVALRPYAAGFSDPEVERFRAWAGDAELAMLAGGAPTELPPDRFRQLFLAKASIRNNAQEQQYAILDEAGELIGRTGLFGLDGHRGFAELGIMIGQRDRWSMGYGRDAVRTLSAHAFAALGVGRIVVYTYPHNVRAQRAFRAVGFRTSRKLRRFSLDRGLHAELEMVLTPAGLRLASEAFVGDR